MRALTFAGHPAGPGCRTRVRRRGPFPQAANRVRLAATTGTVGDQLFSALATLLPLDEERRREAGVWLAVAARANTLPRLARIQAEGNAEVRAACVAALRLAKQRKETQGPVDPDLDGAALAAFVDGLWGHMVNDPAALDADRGVQLLAAHLGRLLRMRDR